MVKANRGHVHIEGNDKLVATELALLLVSYAKATKSSVEDAVVNIANMALEAHREANKLCQ